MMMPVTCTLAEGATVVFDVEDTTADDVDTTSWLFDLFNRTVGK